LPPTTISILNRGIELAEKIKKNQFKICKLGGPTATMPEIWQAALAAKLDALSLQQHETIPLRSNPEFAPDAGQALQARARNLPHTTQLSDPAVGSSRTCRLTAP
jgi:hypothetical protein